MTSFPPPSPEPNQDPNQASRGSEGASGGDGHPSARDPYGQPAEAGQYGQPASADQYGQPAASGQHGQLSGSGPHSPYAAPGSPYAAPGHRPAGTGPAPGTDLASDLGAGLTFAGRAMLRNPAAYLVSALVYSLLILLIMLGATFAGGMLIVAQSEAQGYAAEPTLGDIALVLAVIYGLMLLAVPVSLLWQSGAARSGVVALEGGRPSIGQAMIGPMRVILTALLSGALITVGTLLLYLPGLIAAVLLFYAIPASVRGASPVAAVTESFRLATKNLGTTIVAYLVLGVIATVGSMLILPLVVMIPFFILLQLGVYERVSGRALTEPARA